ncbi:MAG TPA: HD-GYP domain-containing protein [Burkholderiales bacterium]|nr:HD-GYP domain-containing protein [Burkholderiales bacterium]
MNDIRKRIFKRLFTGWLLLSLAMGSVIFYLEMMKVDNLVTGLALEESSFFTSAMDRASVKETGLLRQEARLARHFAMISLYDLEGRRILLAINPNSGGIMENPEVRPFAPSSTIRYRRFLSGGHLYMRITLPLKDRDSTPLGYFDGIYRVVDRTFRNIEIDIAGTLLMVVAVCFITAFMLYPIIISLNRELIKLSSELLKGNVELMDVLGCAIAKRDSDTNAHNYRVTIYAIRLAEALGLDNGRIRNLIAGAFLHDVGKIGIRDAILLKPDRLDEEEFRTMREHVLLGVDIIRRSGWLKGARDVVEFHHEKYDGTGYMKGLKGDEIPLNARIFTVVDVFDALASRRPYKEPIDFEETMEMLMMDRGKRFDPEILDKFRTIAHSLYLEIDNADENRLEAMMNELISRHFLKNT